MPTSTVSEFAAYVKSSDNFVGRRKLVDRVRFRPAGRAEFLSLKTGREPLAVWSVGRVSPSDLFVTPNGSFNKNYTAGSVDEKINNARYRMRLVDPEHPELTPLFVDSVLGIKTIQAMYSGKEPKNLLETDGGFEQIRLSAKTFEKMDSAMTKAADSWPIQEDLAELLSQTTVPWSAVPLKPVLVLRGHPASAHFSHTTVEPSHLQSVLAGAIVAAQFVINHHRFPNHHSFTGLMQTVYVLEPGPDAPEMGLTLFAPRVGAGSNPDSACSVESGVGIVTSSPAHDAKLDTRPCSSSANTADAGEKRIGVGEVLVVGGSCVEPSAVRGTKRKASVLEDDPSDTASHTQLSDL